MQAPNQQILRRLERVPLVRSRYSPRGTPDRPSNPQSSCKHTITIAAQRHPEKCLSAATFVRLHANRSTGLTPWSRTVPSPRCTLPDLAETALLSHALELR